LTVDRHTHPSASTGAALQHCLSDLMLGWGAGRERRQTVMLLPVWRRSTCLLSNGPWYSCPARRLRSSLHAGGRRCRSFGSVAEGVPIEAITTTRRRPKSANGPGSAWPMFPVWVGRHTLAPGRTYHLRAARVSAAGLGRRGPVWILSIKMEVKRPWRSKRCRLPSYRT
jgi:hypothetical protein